MKRARISKAVLAVAVTAMSSTVVSVAGVGAASAPAAAAGPTCSFKGSVLGTPLIANVQPGQTINYHCTGLTPNNPYVLVEASLLIAIDPAAKPLLTGQVTSLAGLLALLAATPEINPQSVPVLPLPLSDGSGNFNYAFTVPSSQPPDPNATCPPSNQELDSGLIGCAVAMIDGTTFKPVMAGTAVLSYKFQPVFPPDPTVALTSTPINRHLKKVSMSDGFGASSFWWLGTLVAILNGLSGGSSGPVPVTVTVGRHVLPSTGTVVPATYNGSVFTPPKLTGSFFTGMRMHRKATISLAGDLLGLTLTIHAAAKIP